MIAVLAVVAALLVQFVLVNRLPLPAGATPDLVLLAVVGAALARGPAVGAALGFGAGLLVDLAPPTAHVAGLYAFVLAVVGYLAGRGVGNRVVTVVVCVLIAPLLAMAMSALLSDPRVTAATLTQQVPVTVACTLLVAPLVVWLASRRRARERYPL
jgi:rod shape-determining protein MreD